MKSILGLTSWLGARPREVVVWLDSTVDLEVQYILVWMVYFACQDNQVLVVALVA